MIFGADRRIHFQERADVVHVVGFAQQIVRPGFRRDSQTARFGVAHHVGGLFRAHMENMQLGAEGFGEKERVVHRFRFADIRPGRFPVARFVFVFLLKLVGTVGHDLAIFGMNAQRQF